MSKSFYEECLDYREWTPLWERLCASAEVFDPLRIREISCIIPMPENKPGVLIIADNGVFTNTHSALTTLQHYSFAHCFPEYTILSSVLKDIGEFGKYKLPWVCPYFSMCPLEGGSNSIWINPLKIENIYELDGLHYLRLLNGETLLIPNHRYTVLLRSEIACGILAAIRQDSFHFSTSGNRPLDYLTLPNTAFAQSLVARPLLGKFVTRTGEVHRRYQRARFLHYYQELENDPQSLHWENWQ